MSSELNKVLCAILSALLVYMLASFIGDLVYHPETKNKKLSYKVELEVEKEPPLKTDKIDNQKIISKKDIEKLLLTANMEDGEKFVTKNCSACHSFQLPVKNKIGPSLAKLIDRKVGSLEGYSYSKSFKTIGKVWSYENLYFFLKKPKSWAPGTKMSYRGIAKEVDLINTLKYLAHVSKLNEG